MTSQTHPVGVTQRRRLLLADTANLRPRSASRVTGDPLLCDDSSTTRQSVEARAPPFSRVVQRRDTNNRPTAGRRCRTPSDQHKLFLLTERCRQSAPLRHIHRRRHTPISIVCCSSSSSSSIGTHLPHCADTRQLCRAPIAC